MKRHLCKFMFALALGLAPLVSNAGVFKCVDSAGRVSFQEKACPTASSSAEITIKSTEPRLSGEDRAWVADRSEMVLSLCLDLLETQPNLQILDPEVGRQICECGTRRYFSNPVSRLRALEAARDIEGNKRLMRPAMTSCAKEIIDKQPY